MKSEDEERRTADERTDWHAEKYRQEDHIEKLKGKSITPLIVIEDEPAHGEGAPDRVSHQVEKPNEKYLVRDWPQRLATQQRYDPQRHER